MRLLRLNEGSSVPEPLAGSPSAPPLKIVVAADHKTWAYCAWQQGEGQPIQTGRALIVDGSAVGGKVEGGEIVQLEGDQTQASAGLWPQGFVASGKLACRTLSAMQTYNGLPAPQIAWNSAGTLYDLKSKRSESVINSLFASAPGGAGAGGYLIKSDPALPAQAQITYFAGSAPGQPPRAKHEVSLPYFVTYEQYQWEPALAWGDATHLIFTAFRPDALGPGAKPNFQGLFRIVALDTADGELSLIEDRVTATASVTAGDGVVFYSLSSGPRGGGMWELWAASLDGLHKQRLYQAAETLGLEPLDCLDGRRLLVHRQHFVDRGRLPELRSELLEFNLDASAGSVPTVDLSPLPQAQGVEEDGLQPLPEAEGQEDDGSQPPTDLMPPESGGGSGDGNGDGFIPDDPEPPSDGGGGGPPPIFPG
jgi:hypothetical protein